jgi:hypothetical protein
MARASRTPKSFDSLKKLPRRQGIEISDLRFEADVKHLTRTLVQLAQALRNLEAAGEAQRLAAARQVEDERRAKEAAEAEWIAREARERQDASQAAEQARIAAEAEVARQAEEVEAERAAREEREREEAAEAERATREEREWKKAAEAERDAREEREKREAAAEERRAWEVESVRREERERPEATDAAQAEKMLRQVKTDRRPEEGNRASAPAEAEWTVRDGGQQEGHRAPRAANPANAAPAQEASLKDLDSELTQHQIDARRWLGVALKTGPTEVNVEPDIKPDQPDVWRQAYIWTLMLGVFATGAGFVAPSGPVIMLGLGLLVFAGYAFSRREP